MSVVVVDTGVANLHSVTSALERLAADYRVSESFNVVAGADRIILPGVGSASAGMRSLHRTGLVELLQNYDRPILGICLGMQLMFESLGESGNAGLGVLEGQVNQLRVDGLPLPHMGWNTFELLTDDPLLDGVESGEYVYFVHSYGADVASHTVAASSYGNRFAAVVRDGNRMGCQFHPERSGAVGAKILQNFLSL